MHGFISIISLKKDILPIEFQWKPLFEFQPVHIKRNFTSGNFQTEQFTSEKFLSDKLWINNEDFFIVTDGLITNIDVLFKKHKVDDYESLIRIISTQDEDFFKQFTGNFVGFFYNKNNNYYTAFNNHTATKKLFYFSNEDYYIFSTDLYTLSKTLEKLEIKKTLDIEASYLLLTSGFMHDDYTLIKEVKQIRAGEYALFDQKKLHLRFYFHLKDIQENTDNEKVIIEKLDILFKEAIRSEFEFEKSRNYTPLTTLSGGLDSRMVALTAFDLNYRNQIMFNFSEKGYADEIIASEIAKSYHLPIFQVHLSPESLLAIDDVVQVNDGLNIYTGISHVLEALKKITDTQIGMIHTGMIGDAVLGSYLSSRQEVKSKISDGLFSNGLLNKAANIIEKSISKYRNEELYKFYNRAFLGINTGFLYFSLIAEASSPFLYPDFISYAHSIPKKFNYKEKIYIDWINKKHPEYASFTWESIGGKPTNNKIIRFIYRLKRAIIKRLPIKSIWKNNMNPEQLWYDENPKVKQYLDNYYSLNIADFITEPELMNDMVQLYDKGNITEKTQVLTLLAAYKLLFR
ncbi:MAG: asparagine synthase-related protein [Paludibacter sp.]|nr:asparagine synthase-related protein [Paludibacter sp.]